MLEKLCAGKDEITEYLDATKFKKIPKETVIFAKSGMSSIPKVVRIHFCSKLVQKYN